MTKKNVQLEAGIYGMELHSDPLCLSVQFVCMDASLQSASILGKIQSGNDVQSAEELRGARPDSLLMLGCNRLPSVSSGVQNQCTIIMAKH